LARKYEQAKGVTVPAQAIAKFTEIYKGKIPAEWMESAVRKHGPKPYMGFVEYVRATQFGPTDAASSYFNSPKVNVWVGKICRLEPDPVVKMDAEL
jgi:hypothetical protein